MMTWTGWGSTAHMAAMACACAIAMPSSVAAMVSDDGPAGAGSEAAGALSSHQGQLTIRFEGLRSTKGLLRACMTRDRAHFPKCEDDPAAFKASVAASKDARMTFSNVPPGDYALMIMHDENSNAKLDTMLGIPREGIGFSRNPRIRFGAPTFESVVFKVSAGTSETLIKLQYFL